MTATEDIFTISATKRDRLGSRYAQRERAAGRLPVVIYGHGQEPLSVTVDAKATVTHLLKGEKVFALDLDGATETVLVKEIQYDYLGTNIIHLDLARVDINERVVVHARCKYVGEAPGLKTVGAIMMHPTEELEIECTVANIPDRIEVDVSDLQVGHSIQAGQITLPLPTMKLLTDPVRVVATIVVKGEEPTAEESEVTAGAEPVVIKEKKEGDED